MIIGNNIEEYPPTSERSNFRNPRSTDLGTAATRNIKNDFEDVARNEDLDRGDFSEVVFPHTRFLSPGQ